MFVNSEFQVVILAGGSGIRLYPLTEEQPKALLPVGQEPLLWYQLNLIEKAGFTEVIVLVANEYMSLFKHFVAHKYQGKIQIDLCGVEGTLETADALRQVQDKIHTDFMVIAGDLVTDVILHNLADTHRIQSSSLTMLLKEENKPAPDNNKQKKREKPRREDDMIDCIGLAEKNDRVVFMIPAVHIEEELIVSKALLKRQPNITFHTNMYDAHLYIFSHWVLRLLNEKKHLASIKTDLVPHLIRLQFRGFNGLSEELQAMAKDEQSLAKSMSSFAKDELHSNGDKLRCSAFILKAGLGYCERADTIAAYEAMKREVKPSWFTS